MTTINPLIFDKILVTEKGLFWNPDKLSSDEVKLINKTNTPPISNNYLTISQ